VDEYAGLAAARATDATSTRVDLMRTDFMLRSPKNWVEIWYSGKGDGFVVRGDFIASLPGRRAETRTTSIHSFGSFSGYWLSG
jgi:hypothetical protein